MRLLPNVCVIKPVAKERGFFIVIMKRSFNCQKPAIFNEFPKFRSKIKDDLFLLWITHF